MSYISYDYQPEGSWFNHDRPYYKTKLKAVDLSFSKRYAFKDNTEEVVEIPRCKTQDVEVPENIFRKEYNSRSGCWTYERLVHPHYKAHILKPLIDRCRKEISFCQWEIEHFSEGKVSPKTKQKIKRNYEKIKYNLKMIADYSEQLTNDEYYEGSL